MSRFSAIARPFPVVSGIIIIGLIALIAPAVTPIVFTPAYAVESVYFAPVPPPPPPADLARAIEELIAECPGRPAVLIRPLDEKWSIAHDADRVVKAASVIKLPILVAALRIAGREGIDLEQSVPILEIDRVGGSGRLKALRRPEPLPLKTLLRLMIVISDNIATNAVIRRFGREELDAEFEAMGLFETRLHNLILKTREDNPTTARESAELLGRLARDKDAAAPLIAKAAHRNLALDWLEEVRSRRRLGRFIPEASRLRNKTGTLRSVVHDVGSFSTDRGKILVAALVSEPESWAAAEEWIARLGRAVHEKMTR